MSEVPERESLTVEFKSDVNKLSDRELVLAAVCLANTDGGTLWLGVEDDGRVTGLHPEHRDLTGLAAMIANRTVPPLSVRATAVEHEGKFVGRVEIARSQRLIASSDGTLQRRRLLADGTPECVPFLPHEFPARESDLRLSDYSALPVAGAPVSAFDALERQRLRQTIERYGGDRSLLGLDDEAFDGALGLTRTVGGVATPTVTGLLLAGREAAIREHLPTHEAAFQLLSGTDVKVNNFYRWPLVRLFERLDELFRAQVREQEVQVGLFRVSVPSVDARAYREAVVNALVHRDYTRLGAVHVRWNDAELSISSPGGFVDGVTLDNLLVVEPRPRNPLLADAFKRLGLAERTGRGVDLIYQGLLRYGRPAPDYSRSDRAGVTVTFSAGPADFGFLELVLEQEQRTQSPLPVESLLALSTLRTRRRVDIVEIAQAIQRPPEAARVVLERLVETGLIQPHASARAHVHAQPGCLSQAGARCGLRPAGRLRRPSARRDGEAVRPRTRLDPAQGCRRTLPSQRRPSQAPAQQAGVGRRAEARGHGARSQVREREGQMSAGPRVNRARPFLIGHARFPMSAPITDKVAPQYLGVGPFSAAEPGRNRG